METGGVTIPQIKINLYTVPRIIVFKIQKDQLELKLRQETILFSVGHNILRFIKRIGI
jgi:hypothetical protein